jgi:Tol biopolymer transport system component
VLLGALALAASALAPPQSRLVLPSLTPDPVAAPRVAFTDDSDTLVVRPIEPGCAYPDICDPPLSVTSPAAFLPGAADHAGEATATRDYADPRGGEGEERDSFVHVSTVDDPNGEVYLRDGVTSAEVSVRVTCSPAVESHPVLSPDGTMVAYASAPASGGSQVEVAWLYPTGGGEPLPCGEMPRVRVTGSGDNFWPTWLDDGLLVFSSTRSDPLGDLYAVRLGPRGAAVPDTAAVRLTTGPAAETQPVAFDTVSEGAEWGVVFTTTEFRRDGSLAGLVVTLADDQPKAGAVASAWPGTSPPQSSEASWGGRARDVSGDCCDDAGLLGYTTTDDDPFGDVALTRLVPTESGSFGYVADGDPVPVSREPGRAESHLTVIAGTRGSGTPSPSLPGRRYAAVYTVRTHLADVSDVVAADGSGRRTVAAQSRATPDGAVPLDESTPTYSPDGLRVAYSRSAGGGREIVTSRADGSDIRPLLSARPDEARDVEPAWSPDGGRIAFVRVLPATEGAPSSSRVQVASVADGSASEVTTNVPDRRFWDENPSWSPDGTRLVVARTVEVLRPDLTVEVSAPRTVTTGTSFPVAATVRNVGPGSTGSEEAVLRIGQRSLGELGRSIRVDPASGGCENDATLGARCRLGSLRAGESVTVTLSARAVRAGPPSGLLAVVEPLEEVRTDNNSATAPVTVEDPPPDVAVTLALPTAIITGRTGTATVTVANTGGPAGAFSARAVAGSAPGSVVFTDVPPACRLESASAVTCSSSGLAPDGSVSWPLTIRGDALGEATVSARVPALPRERDLGNNEASRTTTVRTVPIDRAPARSTPRPARRGGSARVLLGERPEARAAPASAPVAAAAAALAAPPAEVRAVPFAPPSRQAAQLWVLDVGTGAGAPVLLPPDPRCPPTRVCPPTPLAGRVPAWSPDGMRVAFEHRGSVRVARLADSGGDGAADRPEVAVDVDAVTGFGDDGTPTPSRPAISAATDPAWSPDGTELAVTGQPAGQPDQAGVYAIRPDGTGLRGVARDRGPETEPAWQPFTDLAVTLVATPASGAVGFGADLTATVRNDGPAPVPSASFRLEAPAGVSPGAAPPGCGLTSSVLTCPVGPLPQGGDVQFVLPVVVEAPGVHVATGTVGTLTPDRVAANNSATATLTARGGPPSSTPPAPLPRADIGVTVSLTTPGYVGGSTTVAFRVRNGGPEVAAATLTVAYPAALVTVAAAQPCLTGAAPCSLGALAPGSERVLDATLTFRAPGTGTVTAAVGGTLPDPVSANDRAVTPLEVRRPVVSLSPEVVTPGGVTLVSGRDFPPGTGVTLGWDVGIVERRGQVQVGADGTFPPVQVVVMRRDVLGVRNLRATGSVPGQFTPVTARLLVAPRNLAPPAFVERN